MRIDTAGTLICEGGNIVLKLSDSIPGTKELVKFVLDFSTPEIGPHAQSIAEQNMNGVTLVHVVGDVDKMPSSVNENCEKLIVHNLSLVSMN